MTTCPNCHSSERQIKDGRTAAGSQRYRCKLCGRRYTPDPQESGYDEEVRLQALRLYKDGVSLRGVSRILDVNHQSVANWINAYATRLPLNLPASVLEMAILDGIYSQDPHRRGPKPGADPHRSTPRD